MCWADRATVLIGLFWAVFAFVLTGGAQRPDLGFFEHLYVFGLFWGLPLVFVWVVLRLVIGNRGAVARY